MMKSTFLQVMGIISIVFGAINVILALIAFAGYAVIEAATGVSFTFVGVVALILSVIMLVAGILGVVFCTKPEKAIVCKVFGVIWIIIRVVEFFMESGLWKQVDLSQLTGVSVSGTSPLGLILGLILPVLYLIATFCYKPKN